VTTIDLEKERRAPRERSGDGRCRTCGAELPAGFRFCGQCGRALAETLAPAPGELLTIAFIDLDGFSTFASRAPPGEVRELIRSFHGLVREQVERHRGFEVKQLGDGFMLAFSSPRRAVACAADIQRVLARRWGAGEASPVRACAGLNSGDAVREGDDFFGHTVNLASRIAGRARGGQVLVAEATRVLAGHVEGLRFVDAGRRQFRGLPGRHRVFEVVWWE
jgi:class 3 adenylate cyclase